jgi:inorganic pyrophosphatase
VFPIDFGFVPSTLGEDGDPLDVLLLMDQPTFPGCLVTARLLGVIQARQSTRKGKMFRNDRLVAAAELSHRHAVVHSLKDVDALELDEIEHFFSSYNEQSGKKFKPLGRGGPKRAEKLLEEGIAKHRTKKKRKHAA